MLASAYIVMAYIAMAFIVIAFVSLARADVRTGMRTDTNRVMRPGRCWRALVEVVATRAAATPMSSERSSRKGKGNPSPRPPSANPPGRRARLRIGIADAPWGGGRGAGRTRWRAASPRPRSGSPPGTSVSQGCRAGPWETKPAIYFLKKWTGPSAECPGAAG